jgi:glycosyltransferase involved in cell wall biosynthesis
LHEIERRESAWDKFFQARGIRPWNLVYEDICDNPLAAVHAVARHVGINERGIARVASPLCIVRDATTRRWVQQFSTSEAGMYLGDRGPVKKLKSSRQHYEYAHTASPSVVTTVGEPREYSPSQRMQGLNGKVHDRPALRVAHVGQSMVRAGIEQWLKSLIRFSNPQRLQFTRCVATSSQVDPDVIAEMGVPVEVGQAEAVQRAVQECDVLLCWGPAELPHWLQGARPRLCVFVAHGESDWTRRLLDGCASVVDHVVAVSERVRDKVCHGFPTTVIPNGVDAAHVAQCRPREDIRRMLGFGSDDFVLGYVGRFSHEKNPERLLEAVAELPLCFKALLVGWGHLLPDLMELANDLIPGRYAFATADSYLGDYYNAMDTLCLVSDVEGFALVVLEAMLCERPVIVSPVGCVPEVIKDRINGIVVGGNASSVADAARLLKDYPLWARGLAAEGRRYAVQNGHAWHMARRYEELLGDLWSQRIQSTPA